MRTIRRWFHRPPARRIYALSSSTPMFDALVRQYGDPFARTR